MELCPKLILLFAPFISAKDATPLLHCNRAWAQWLKQPHLAELLQVWAAWARDLFVGAPNFSTVLMREDLAADVAWCQHGLVRQPKADGGRYETPTDKWLLDLIGLRSSPRSAVDPGRALRLLGVGARALVHSRALWTISCAALLGPDVKLKEAEPMRFLIKLERAMKTYEDEGLFEFGLDLLGELYRAMCSKWSQPRRHFNTGLQLACRALLLWPENPCMVDSAVEVASSCLAYVTWPTNGLKKAFAKRLESALRKNPWLKRPVRASVRAILDLQGGGDKELTSLLSACGIAVGVDPRPSGRSTPLADSSKLAQ